MEPISLLVLLVMGTLAGAINAAVGSGSLLTLPVLLALGVPPGTAIRTNTIGILFSTIGSVTGYRREIAAQRHELGPLVVVVTVMAAVGSVLLLLSPSDALDVVVPVLIVLALLMVVFQKRVTRAIRERSERRRAARGEQGEELTQGSALRRPGLLTAMGAGSIYGGYFTAAQGILYLGVMGAITGRSMKDLNAVKNLASLMVNAAAATVYLIAHLVWGVEILWIAMAAIAVGALLGGYFGAHLAKRLPESAMRGLIVVVALVALVRQVM